MSHDAWVTVMDLRNLDTTRVEVLISTNRVVKIPSELSHVELAEQTLRYSSHVRVPPGRGGLPLAQKSP